ncbi:response regulator [Phaeovibrio sulfidiphilus]|uniref:histidine kinase n=1 Tax=Phaeovibrio sulfidiphilus TaxID=1220600 RepID=A0A8J7CEM4_9PROT|nr:hybrid sensor histidine kinase/response regulator [Phaeovibrio sulfidiphilus]MBE1237729.1 response regulator [Phaeovibrio sulfidiphilus]
MTIRLRLLLAFSLCLLLACCLTSTIVFFYVRDVDERNFRALAMSHLEGVEERITAFMEPGWMGTRYLAELPALRDSRGKLSSYLDAPRPTTRRKGMGSSQERQIYDELLRMHRSNGNFGVVFMSNEDGQFVRVPDSNVIPPGYDPRDRPWYRDAMEAPPGSTVVSAPYVNIGGALVCSIITRVNDMEGKPLGMVGVDFSLESLTADLGARRIMDTGYLVILDRRGQVLVDGQRPDAVPRPVSSYSVLWRQVLTGPDGEYTGPNTKGVMKYIVTRTIPDLDWKLAVVFNQDELLKASRDLLRIMLWSTLAVFLFTLSIAIALARSITRPMEDLVDASAIISDGRYETSREMRDALRKKLAVQGSPETVRLSSALRSMIITLQDRVDAAEAADRAKGEFLANMSHELFTPLNAVIGLNHALRNSCLDSVQKGYAEKIASSAKTLLTLINDLLDFSKAEAGNARLYEHVFSLREVVKTAAGRCANDAAAKNLEYTWTVREALPDLLVGDSRKLERVLVNILSNAVKFTRSGSITLDVAPENTGDRHVLVHFCVTDTGIGIDDDLMKTLFSPFVQADSSATRRFGGTGLGLALGQKYVTLMGGRLWAESEPGTGSTFHVVLPFVFAPRPEPRPARLPEAEADTTGDSTGSSAPEAASGNTCESAREDAGGSTPDTTDVPVPECPGVCAPRAAVSSDRTPEGPDAATRCTPPAATSDDADRYRGKRVLVVEDNPLNQLVTANLLEQISVEVSVANNGVEALQMLSEQNFNLVLMDIQMPEMDGLTATRCIREDPKYATLPIVALTAHGSAEDRLKSLAAGMNDHMSKPVEAEAFYACIKKWLA